MIVEHEQGGEDRAAYGAQTLQTLAQRLSTEFGRGFSLANLRNFRQFFLTFTENEIRYTPCSELGWSHFRLLMRVPDPAARQWYAAEAVSQTWSVAALDRQISTLYYQRLLSSQDQDGVKAEASALIQRDAPPSPRDFIRDPYILEFLGGQQQSSWYKKDVEQCLLDQLQKFLLELGKGFAFVARQRHLRIEGEDAFVDLVFYNYNLHPRHNCRMTSLAHQLLDTSPGGLAERLVAVVRARFPLTMAVYVFGSQVQGQADARSDLDLAVLVAGYADPLVLWDASSGELADIAGCPVDLLDLRAASTVMQYQVITTGRLLWSVGLPVGLFECFVLSEKTALDEARAPLLADIAATGRIYAR